MPLLHIYLKRNPFKSTTSICLIANRKHSLAASDRLMHDRAI